MGHSPLWVPQRPQSQHSPHSAPYAAYQHLCRWAICPLILGFQSSEAQTADNMGHDHLRGFFLWSHPDSNYIHDICWFVYSHCSIVYSCIWSRHSVTLNIWRWGVNWYVYPLSVMWIGKCFFSSYPNKLTVIWFLTSNLGISNGLNGYVKPDIYSPCRMCLYLLHRSTCVFVGHSADKTTHKKNFLSWFFTFTVTFPPLCHTGVAM